MEKSGVSAKGRGLRRKKVKEEGKGGNLGAAQKELEAPQRSLESNDKNSISKVGAR